MKLFKYFVDTDHKVVTDEKRVDELLKQKSDKEYYTENGSIEVSKERWCQAQQFEKKYWMEIGVNDKSDRNEEHATRFDNYGVLKDRKFKNAIELGAGVFTNLRLIRKRCSIEGITLLDPLISQYIYHPNCTYKNDFDIELVNSTIEEYETEEKFDLVVMLNTLEHCFSVDKVFSKIKEIKDESGLFVFSEATVKDEYVKYVSENVMDIGHPLRISSSFLEKYIECNYQVLYKKVFDNLYDNQVRRDFYYVLR